MNRNADDGPNTLEFKHVNDPNSTEDIRQLFLEYAESLHTDLSFQNFEDELKTLPGKYGPPDGILLLALLNGKPSGCIALRKISDGICEMKRLFVRKEHQGLGHGKQLIAAAIKEAKVLHYDYMRLDTLPTMKKAQDLYLAFGFYDIEPYVYNPISGTRFMELKL